MPDPIPEQPVQGPPPMEPTTNTPFTSAPVPEPPVAPPAAESAVSEPLPTTSPPLREPEFHDAPTQPYSAAELGQATAEQPSAPAVPPAPEVSPAPTPSPEPVVTAPVTEPTPEPALSSGQPKSKLGEAMAGMVGTLRTGLPDPKSEDYDPSEAYRTTPSLVIPTPESILPTEGPPPPPTFPDLTSSTKDPVAPPANPLPVTPAPVAPAVAPMEAPAPKRSIMDKLLGRNR